MVLVHGFTVRQIGPNSLCHLCSRSPVLTGSSWYQARFLVVSVGQILYPKVLKDVNIALPSMHSYSRKWLDSHWERIGGIVNININLWWPSMILPWEDPLSFLSIDARFVNWLIRKPSEGLVSSFCSSFLDFKIYIEVKQHPCWPSSFLTPWLISYCQLVTLEVKALWLWVKHCCPLCIWC